MLSIIRARYFHRTLEIAAEQTAARLEALQAQGLHLRRRHEIIYCPVGGSYLKFVKVPPQGPAFRGALAWAYRKPGRQVTFGWHGKPILFEESQI